jgi:hypothetical protein
MASKVSAIDRVSIRPGVSLLSVLPHLNYTHWHALGEFVDNALQSYQSERDALRAIEGESFVLSVDIDVDPERGEIRIRDNAAGIRTSAYLRAFRPAEAPPSNDGLSEFGMGMKSASAWLAPRWRIRSSALGERVTREVTFDIAEIVGQSVEDLEVTTGIAHLNEHFTEIVLERVRKIPQRRTLAKIQDHLAGLYRRFLERGDLRLSINGAPVSYEMPQVLTAPHWRDPSGPLREWRKSVSISLEGGRRAEGWVAIRARGSTTRAGLALLRRDRVIEGSADEGYRPREVFGSSNSFAYQRLFGEFDLINFEVSHTKDGVRWDEAEEEFATKLKTALSDPQMPLLDQAHNWRAAESAAAAITDNPEALAGHSMAARAATQMQAAFKPSAPLRIQSRPLKVADDATWRRMTLELSDTTWEVNLAFDYSEAAAEWIEVGAPLSQPGGSRQLQVKLSMHHPFSKRFMRAGDEGVEIVEGVARIAAGLAIAEAIAQEDGVRFSGRIRTSLNELLWLGLAD